MFLDSPEPPVRDPEGDIDSVPSANPSPITRTALSLIMMCPSRYIADEKMPRRNQSRAAPGIVQPKLPNRRLGNNAPRQTSPILRDVATDRRLRGGKRLAALQAKQALLLGSAAVQAYRDRIARQTTPQLGSETVAIHGSRGSGLDDDLQRNRSSRASSALTQEAQPTRRRVPPGRDFWMTSSEILDCA